MGNTIYDFLTSEASSSATGGVNTAEGQLPSTVNDGMRQLKQLVASFVDDQCGVNTVGGTAAAITVTAAQSWTAYATGLWLAFKASGTNVGAVTINVNAIGAKAIRRNGDTALSAGDIVSGGKYLLVYDAAYNAAAGAWVILNPAAMGGVSAFALTLLDDADAATARATLGLTIGTAIREVLTATRTYYVRTDGSDSNTGLADTAGGAFLTIQKAINVVASLDRSTYQVTITVGAGTFSETISFYPGVGTLAPLVNGAGATSTFLKGIACAGTQAGSSWRISNVGFYDTAAGWGIKCSGAGFLDIASVDFGGTTRYQHARIESGFVLTASGNFSISGGTSQQAFDAIHADIDFHSRTITVTADITLSTFMSARGGSYVQVWSCTFTVGAFTVTGTRYVANENGVLSTGGGGASFIPGTVGGSTATGGQYT